jgi:hypothetical protein
MEESYFTSLPEGLWLDKRFSGNDTKRKEHSAPPRCDDYTGIRA